MNIIEKFENAQNQISQCAAKVKKALQSDKLTLAEKWALFTKFEKFLPKSNYYVPVKFIRDNGKTFELTYFDDLYLNRSECILSSELIERLEDSIYNFSESELDQVKAILIREGFGRIVNDW